MVGRSVVVAVALMFSFATSSLGAFVAIRPIRFVGDTKVVTFAKRKRQSRQRPIAEVSAPELLVVGNDVHVDMERARQCAEVFGHCSVEEMEHLKSGTLSSDRG